jgi:3-phenylpropionate/trans-cinnamate dioxygenase ferredoxin reductase subunit
MSKPIVIIGAGQCGLKAVETLRQNGYDGALVLIGDETQPPYQRPPLSKAYLKGELEEDRLYLKADNFYEDNKVTTKFGVTAQSINRDEKSVSLSNGELVEYDKLLISTGTVARQIPLKGAELDGVHTLRTIDDVKRLSAAISPDMKIGIIGAGYIGLEVAASLRGRGNDVTVIEAAPRVLARVMPEEMSAFFQSLHEGHGVNFHIGKGTKSIEGEGKVEKIVLDDGAEIPCDIVLLSVGASPVIGIAEAAGLKIDNGIFVNEMAQTSDADIYAAGDCASFFSKRYDRIIRLESVQNAIDQGKVAAQAMLGQEISYNPLPWFWSDQYDVKLQIAGLSQGFDRLEIEGDMSENCFTVTYFKDEKPICVDAVNQPRAHMMARRSLNT